MFKLTVFLEFGSKFEKVYFDFNELQVEHMYMQHSQKVLGYNIERLTYAN